MSALETLRAAIPETARDIRLNMQTVMQPGVLSPAQRWGVAVAASVAARNVHVRHAVTADALREVGPAVIDDAQAAAALMAMNNVYYRFRHLVGKAEYLAKPARLRMNRM